MEQASAPLHTPHALVPHGQMKEDTGHSVTPEGQTREDSGLAPPNLLALKRMFDEARDLTDKARVEQQRDQDYYDTNGQATAEIRQTLKMRGQPLVIDNRIAPAIDGILGVMESGKTDPRAFPRNPEDQAAADVATKALRYMADKARWASMRMDCAEDYLKLGLTAAIVEMDGEEIVARRIRWETFFYDPKSREHDFCDAKYMGIAKWMYSDEVKGLYPKADKLGELTVVADETPLEATWDDRPNERITWVDRRRNRVLVVEIYYRTNQGWLRAVFCAAGTLEYGVSPYVNPLTGEPRCPIEAQSFKVDRENNRYGPIRSMVYMQDEVNARRSRGLHLLNNRQLQQTESNAPPVDADEARREAARADGIIPAGWQMVPSNDLATGNLNMLAEAKDSLSRMVPVAIAQDLREGSAASGRARQVAQQAGLTQFGRGFGRFEDFEERIYRQFWMCAQQFKTGPWWVRVTDNPKAPEFLQVNEPVMGPTLEPIVDPATGQPVIDPSTEQPAVRQVIGIVSVKNRIASMDMDIIIAATPDTVALEFEVFEAVMQLVQSGIDPMSPAFQVMIELAPLPSKTEIMEKIEAIKQQMQQGQEGQQQAQQAAVELEMEEKKATTAAKFADAAKTIADTDEVQARTLMSMGLDPLIALGDGPIAPDQIEMHDQPMMQPPVDPMTEGMLPQP